MDASGTEALRSSATHWTLAGDKQLLQLLQDIHEKVVTRCQETNSLLEQMATSLNEANIDVQSVNNKLMSLSNSQFVESRVYGDDADLTTDPVPQKEEPKPPDSPLNKTKQSLHVLDSMHDSFEIYDDTDSDSDSDNCISSTVLKPKDVYSHRPLPYIIGSYNWRTKWHVGLIHQSSDSDEDSNAEKPSQKNEYSDTESVKEEARERSRTLSSSSSERRSVPVPPKMPEAPVLSPVDIASELARRLGNVPQMPSVSQDFEPPKMSTGKIYRPEQPTAATIFPDEPPPLDQTVSDGEFEEEEDIFAELHRNGQKGTAREEQRQSTPPPLSKQVSNLFDGDSDSELFAPKHQVRFAAEQSKPVVSDNIVKKPVGGISLFGKNSFGESIGPAIIRRHRRKSSSSDDNTDNDEQPKQETKTEPIKNESVVKTKEKDFINVLFPKPRSKDEIQKDKPKASLTVVKIEEKKVDLFNDNLFDDIDDIFSSNIVKTTPTNNAQKPKPLFDDDDDLFAEVSASQPVKVLHKNDDTIKKKSLFDSDDELFSEIPETPINKVISSKNPIATKSNTSKVKETKVKSIFDDSSDDDDNIFGKIVTSKPIRETTIISDHTLISKDSSENAIKSDNNFNAVSKTKDENIFINVHEQIKITTMDVDNNNLNNSSDGYITQHQVTKIKTNNEIRRKHVTFQSPSLFDDDNDDTGDLFSKENSNDTKSNDALSVQKGDNNMEIESPAVSSDVKNTNRVLAEETPLKKSEGESKRIVDVDDSLLEEEFEQHDDYDSNEPSQSNEKDKSDDIKSSDDTKQKSEQISETSNKVDEKAEDDLDFSRSTESTPPPVEKPIKGQLRTTNKNTENIEKAVAFDNNIKVKEISSVATPFTEEPPAFEKPKESKKSKNINALFDDDSDDEALFFKKSDAPLVDEKPELFSAVDSSKNRFGVFLDEPPDVNVDFTQKDVETKRKTVDKQETLPVETKEDYILDKPPSKPDQTEQNIGNSVDKIVSETKDNKKPIGKLKMNLNINVNTLLPGASPKKTVKIKEHVETEHSTNTPTEELVGKVPPKEDERTTDNKGDVMTRSASFEGDPEANVLDNKLSKQRPRIQVKRRPSTRRARHEAVRKSVIDLTDDSTDNSSSIDDNSAPISKDVTTTDVSKANDDGKIDYIQNESIDATENKTEENIKDSKQFVDSIEVTERKDVKSKVVYILNDEDIFTNTNDDVKDTVDTLINNALDQYNPTSDSVDKSSDDLAKSDKKDEDILKDLSGDHVNTESNPIKEQIEEEEPISNIVDEIFDELFKSSKKVDAQPKPILKHSESVKSETQKPKIFLFDDLSEDEDLFKPNTSNASKPKNIFGSDTDDDIFVSKKKETETKDVEKGEKVEVKKSLFSDDDDDDDLFGAKKSSVEKKTSVKSTTSKSSQQLTVKDPLAMLDDVYENAKRSFK